MASTTGFSTGANPSVEAIYRLLLRGSFSDVPVFAPTLYPETAALLPEPSETTDSRIILILSDVSLETTFSLSSYVNFLTTVLSALSIRTPKWGVTIRPPLITALTVVKSRSGVNWNDCPNDIVANSTAPTFFFWCIIVAASPGISTPVFCKIPSFSIWVYIPSTPRRAPTSIKTGLQEFCTPCTNVSAPCPVVLWHRILLSSTILNPGQLKVSVSFTTFASKAEVAVTILNVEPGS